MQLRLVPAALAALALLACAPKDPHDLGHKLVVHGVVTDAATGALLPGVKVTLLSTDSFPTATTDARGYFRFLDVLQVENLLVQFQLDSYATATRTVNPTALADAGCLSCDGGVGGLPAFPDPDGLDASIALVQSLSLPVNGVVRAGPDLARQASVLLADVSSGAPVIAYQAKTGDDGRFSFAAVRASTYQLWVLPYDRDGDGISDFQLFKLSLGSLLAGTQNLSNLVVVLADVRQDLEASSFVNFSTSYPVSIHDLQAGQTGVLQTPGPFFLQFGAEVDQALTSFALVQKESTGRTSPPLAITVAWTSSVTVTITPTAALVATAGTGTTYELQLKALRFKDGGTPIPPGAGPGLIDFTVASLPVPLPSPTPAFYLGSQFTATQTATQAVVDATVLWLLDANGDFIFDTNPAANWGPANLPQISWQHVPGAVRYHVQARNTTGPSLQWREVSAVAAPDPNANPTVVATLNLYASNLFGSPGAPWLFGNEVDIAVTSEDANGFQSDLDPSKALKTSDSFGGLITSAVTDVNLAFPFNSTSERGLSFVKSFRLDFSEPMNTTSPLAFASGNSNLTIVKINDVAWGTGGTIPATPPSTGNTAFVNASLKIAGACTELLADRSAGDTLLPVRDSSIFAAGAASRIVLLSTAGALLAELTNLTSVAAGLITLGTPIPGAAGTPVATRGQVACGLQAPASLAKATTIGAGSTSMMVDNPSLFFVGEQVLVYEPQAGATAPVADVRTLVGLDTTTNTLVLSAAPAAGHTVATLVLPLAGVAAEVALRPSQVLTLVKDLAGGPGVDLALAAAAPVMVGDLVLVDADGDLKTTTDQVQVKVKAVKMAAAPFAITVDLPAATSLLHGRARVIALGDTITVSGVHDTSSTTTKPHNLDPHRDQFTADGFIY